MMRDIYKTKKLRFILKKITVSINICLIPTLYARICDIAVFFTFGDFLYFLEYS